jgi:hypothetical protein
MVHTAFRIVAISLLLVQPAVVVAQAPPSSMKRVVPGDTSLRVREIRTDTLRYALTGFRDGDEIAVGSIIDIVTREAGTPEMLRRVLVVQRGNASLIDSTLSDARTLAPRQHRSWQPQRHLQLDFSGLRLRGSIGPPDAQGAAIDTTIASPAFDSGNWDLVVRALPLDSGYAARFPVYDLETGLHEYRVRVIGATTMLGEQAHVVLFQLGGTQEVTVWIGATTRRLLQVETPVGPTTLLRQTLRLPQAR